MSIITRETYGIPLDEDPWSQVPDPSNPLNTARAYFEHFLQDNGGLRKENDGEPRRYANVFFDFRRGRSKYYRDVLGIDNGKVSTLASQDWQLVKSTEYGKKFWKQVADETARLYDTRFPGQRQRQPIYPTPNRPVPLAGGIPSVLAPPIPPIKTKPSPINVRRRSTSHAQVSPSRPSPRYTPYSAVPRLSPPVARSLPTHYEMPYASSPLTPVAPPPHVLPVSDSYPRSLSMDTNTLQPPNFQPQRHSVDMGVFAYEGTTAVSPQTSYYPTPTYSYDYAQPLNYVPRTYSPNPTYAPVTHIDPTLFAGSAPKYYDQGVSPTCINPDLPRINSTPMLAGEYEYAWTPELQL